MFNTLIKHGFWPIRARANSSVNIILFDFKVIKKIYRTEKRYSWKHAKIRYSGMQIIAVKSTIRTLYVHVISNGVMFRQISFIK